MKRGSPFACVSKNPPNVCSNALRPGLLSRPPVLSHHHGTFNSIAEGETVRAAPSSPPLSRAGLWQEPSPYSSNWRHVRGINRHTSPPSG